MPTSPDSGPDTDAAPDTGPAADTGTGLETGLKTGARTGTETDQVLLRRLLPEPGLLTAAELLDGAALADLAPPHRPYVVLNMVTTADGAAAVSGRTAPMGSPADRAVFHELRTRADAVLVGAGTLRIEGYGRLVHDQHRRARRVELGLPPNPIAVVASRSLSLTPDLPLLTDPESHVVVLTTAREELAGCAARVDYLRPEPGRPLDLREALRRLRTEYGVRALLCEGGPTLNASLVPAGLVDELFLTTAPKIVGEGGALSIVDRAPLADPVGLDLVWLLESEGNLFARYRLRNRDQGSRPRSDDEG